MRRVWCEACESIHSTVTHTKLEYVTYYVVVQKRAEVVNRDQRVRMLRSTLAQGSQLSRLASSASRKSGACASQTVSNVLAIIAMSMLKRSTATIAWQPYMSTEPRI